MTIMYYPLHVHTAIGSVGDSTLRIPDYVAKAKKTGLDKLVITDHGSLSAMYYFIEECNKVGIGPVIGMEAYVTDDINNRERNYSHLVLIAKDDIGLRNLTVLHNLAQTEGFYYKPRVSHEEVFNHTEGLIVLSACIAGAIPSAVLEGRLDKAETLIQQYKEHFYDDFYLELQPGNFKEQKIVNDTLVKLAEKTDVQIVITNDIHYLSVFDAVSHNYHVKLGRKKEKEEITDDMIYPDVCYWFMTEKNVRAYCKKAGMSDNVIEEGIAATQRIIQKCSSCSIKNVQPEIPQISTDADTEVARLCQDKLGKLKKQLGSKMLLYQSRLRRELAVISQKGFSNYFLIVRDYISWAKSNGIKVGPGRGSAAGSLVSYLLGISMADPIKYGLLFERFLDPERQAIPDIDVDISASQRDQVIAYLKHKYGESHCAQISAIHVRKTKSAVRDAFRILGPSYMEREAVIPISDEITKLIPTVFYDDEGNKETDLDLQTALTLVPELKRYQEQYPDIFALAMSLEGLPNSSSIHAAGIVISPRNLVETIPLVRGTNPDILATSLDLESAEKTMVKFDLLSLSTLDIIRKTEEEAGIVFDYENNNFNDPKVWDVINCKYVAGVFQISSPIYRQRMWRLKPRNIKELAACLALLRGPCISAGLDEEYMLIQQKKKRVQLIHPLYDNITKDTNGIVIYQEQIMNLAVSVGFSLSEGYRLVKAIAKKKLADIKEYKGKFIDLATQQTGSVDIAIKIFSVIERSAAYAFNQSHAVSYAMLVYASAWLKYYCTDVFMKVLLTEKFTAGKTQEYTSIVNDCKEIGVPFLPVSVNDSDYSFKIEDDGLRIGLCSVKGLGEKAIAALLAARQQLGGTVNSLEELYNTVIRQQFNKNKFIVSIFAGIFDCFLSEGETRYDLYVKFCNLADIKVQDEVSIAKGFTIKTKSKAFKGMQTQLFGAVFFDKEELKSATDHS